MVAPINPNQFSTTSSVSGSSSTGTSSTSRTGRTSDSTSSGGGSGSSSIVWDAGVPRLMNPENASSADLMMFIHLGLDLDRRTRRRSAQERDENQGSSVWSMRHVRMSAPDEPENQNNANQSNQSSSSTNASATTTTNANTTTSVTELRLQGTLNNLETTAVSDVEESIRRRFHHRIPSGLMDALQAYIHSVLASGLLLVIPPAVNLLGQEPLGFRVDDRSVNSATAVTFQAQAMNWIDSGEIDDFVAGFVSSEAARTWANSLYPEDPTAVSGYLSALQTTITESLSSSIVRMSLGITGTALGMPGYANQVLLQAQLVRDENTVLGDGTHMNQIAEDVAVQNAGGSGLSEPAMKTMIRAAIQKTMFDAAGNAVHYSTRADLLAALEANYKLLLPNNPELAATLALATENQAQIIAMGSNQALLSPFDAQQFILNPPLFTNAQASLINAIQKEFAESDAEIRQATRAKALADEILSDVLNADNLRYYRSSQDIRNAIIRKLVQDPETEITLQQATSIAASVNLGVPATTGPLYDPNNTRVLSPADFALSLQTGYQESMQISPLSNLGQAINLASGVGNTTDEADTIRTINDLWYSGDTETRSYLNPSPDDAARYAQLELGDPATSVKEWGIQQNNQRRSSRVDILL